LAILTQIIPSYLATQNYRNICFKEKPPILAENWRKSPKIGITTLTPKRFANLKLHTYVHV
jgi:hypothetical protein